MAKIGSAPSDGFRVEKAEKEVRFLGDARDAQVCGLALEFVSFLRCVFPLPRSRHDGEICGFHFMTFFENGL